MLPNIGNMWPYLVLASLLVTGSRAFAPLAIRWTGLPAQKFVLAPEDFSNGILVPHQRLTIREQSDKTLVPCFAAGRDNTISCDGWCVTADGSSSGDVVRVSRCTGDPAQRWDSLPHGGERKNQIQLRGVNKCLAAIGREGGVAIELRDCEHKATQAWDFEEPFPFPTQSSLSSSMWHSENPMATLIFFAAMALLGASSLSASLWRRARSTSYFTMTQHGVPLNVDPGGVSLAAQPKMPAVMTINATADGDTSDDKQGSDPFGTNPTLAGESEQDVFRRIAYRRRAARNYDASRDIPDDVMADILATAQRAPTTYNAQPYKVVVVRDRKKREQIADAFLGGNGRRVRTAPVTVIFLADLEPARLIPKILELGRKQGLPADFLGNIPRDILGLTAPGRFGIPTPINVATTALSPFVALPVLSDVEAWSAKNTCLVASQMMLAATSHGVSSSPMEGFDSRRIFQILNIPITEWTRYAIPLAISMGYDVDPDAEKANNPSLRFPPEDVFFKDEFGAPYRDIAPM